MKYVLYTLAGSIILFFLFAASTAGAQVTSPNRGGTGTTTIPTTGQVLVGQSNGTYGPQATSSLNISVGTSNLLTLAGWYATTTDGLNEGLFNQYFTNARARSALSETISGISYDSGTGVFSLDGSHLIPLIASTTEWARAYASSTVLSATSPLAYAASTGAFSISNDGIGDAQLTFDTGQSLTTLSTPTFAGLVATGSSTIGSGTQQGGLTISGGATTTGNVRISSSGTVGAPALQINSNAGLYLVSAGSLGFTNGTNGLTWNGTSFIPNTDTARTLGSSANRWLDLWLSGTATTTNLIATNSTTTGSARISGSLSLGSLSGILQGTSGLISASSTIGIGSGGTNNTAFSTNGVVYHDGSKLANNALVTYDGSTLELTTAPTDLPFFNINGTQTINSASASAVDMGAIVVDNLAAGTYTYFNAGPTYRPTAAKTAFLGFGNTITVDDNAGTSSDITTLSGYQGAFTGASGYAGTIATYRGISMLNPTLNTAQMTNYMPLFVNAQNAASNTAALVIGDLTNVGNLASIVTGQVTIPSGKWDGYFGANFPSAFVASTTGTTSDSIVLKSARGALQAGDFLGGLAWWSDDTNLTAGGLKVGGIQMFTTQGHSGAALGSDMRFSVTPTNTIVPVEAMRIDQNGRLGIGTTSPGAQLTVAAGDVYIASSTRGIILKSPNGTCGRGTLTDALTLTFATTTCP